MTCGDVRDRLPEHALGLLGPEEAASVDRHLDWCPGCRKELEELNESVAEIGLALPPAEPAPLLEERVVDLVATAAGRRKPVHRRGLRVLAVTTLAATLTAFGALGWAVAEHQRADDIRASVDLQREVIDDLRRIIDQTGGRRATLLPTAGHRGSGLAVIISPGDAPDGVFVEVVMEPYAEGPYTVRLLDRSGHTRLSGQLATSNNESLVLWQETGRDLLDVVSVVVLDGAGLSVLRGDVPI
jgi:anti-sigma factor RsiW